jgi:microcystin-dependent protein
MSCTNCFSGCVETTSDKCVKYTGNSIEFLSINTGDSLEAVEQAITDYLATVFDGSGIIPTIDPTIICDTVKQFFPTSGSITLNVVLSAIIKAICLLETQISAQSARIDTIEANYTVGCLDVDPSVGTHAILQATITALCSAIGDIGTLQELFATCITTANINSYIQNYINAQTDNNMYTKMVPYVIYPFYPSASIMSAAFDINGVGLGTWKKIYLCNGYNGLTPDLRGRSLIGTTDMGNGPFNPAVDPGTGNPAYSLGTLNGQNVVTLSPSQIPSHTHDTTVLTTDPTGTGTIDFGISETQYAPSSSGLYPVTEINGVPADIPSVISLEAQIPVTMTGFSVSVAISPNTPSGEAHNNVHPVIGVYYVMYLP